MPEVVFKKRRGVVFDMFAVLWMYSSSTSLNVFFKSYNVKPSEELYDSYSRICGFIDKNVKQLKPFFVKSVNSPDAGSIFMRVTQMLVGREDLLIRDVLNYFRGMKPLYFLAEVFRITEGRPESERSKYISIIKSPDAVTDFINSQNYTVREKRAIKAFYDNSDYEYEHFIMFIERLYNFIEKEHRINADRIARYTDWLKARLSPYHEEYLFESEEFKARVSALSGRVIVTVSLFPPYSLNRLTGESLSVLCFGIGAFTQYAEICYKKQNRLRENHCEMRTRVILFLADGPKRLIDIANGLGTSSADISYHIGVLEKKFFIKRVRLNDKEHFALIQNGFDFIEKRKKELKEQELLSNG